MAESPSSTDRVRSALAIAALLRTREAETARAVLAVLAHAGDRDSVRLTRHRLRLLLEDHRLGADEDEIWDLLVRSGVARAEGKHLVLGRELLLEEQYDEIAPRDRGPVQLEDILDLLRENRAEGDLLAATPRELAPAILRGQAWGAELLQYAAAEGMSGFPVFWDRDGEQSKPFGVDIGTMAASDTLLLCLEPAIAGFPLPDSPKLVVAVERAWDQLLALGIDSPDEWYDGSLEIPFFDDDFVGAFTKEHAARGSCPTLEATAERAYALMVLRTHVPTSAERAAATKRAIAAALRCVIRWQADEGGWPIHSYPPGSGLSMPMRDVSTWYAVRTLLSALEFDLVPADLRDDVLGSLTRARELLVRMATVNDDRVWWDGDFLVTDADPRWRATVLLARLVGPLARRLGDDALLDLLRRAVAWLADGWEPDAEQVMGVEFRCPTWEGAALATFTWELPRDALAIQAFTAAERAGVVIEDGLAARIHRAAAGLLAEEASGSWLDVPLKREGLSKAFGSNSLHALRALLDVLSWETAGLLSLPQR